MFHKDDPRVYRHSSNAHPRQALYPLDIPAGKWLKGRLRLEQSGILTRIIPEVYAATGESDVDPNTGVPIIEGNWTRVRDTRSGRLTGSTVLTGLLPGGSWRLRRALRVWNALFHARAVVPEVEGDIPD